VRRTAVDILQTLDQCPICILVGGLLQYACSTSHLQLAKEKEEYWQKALDPGCQRLPSKNGNPGG